MLIHHLQTINVKHARESVLTLGKFPTEQKGCKKKSFGCEDELLVNKMILEGVKKSPEMTALHGLTTKRRLIAFHTRGY